MKRDMELVRKILLWTEAQPHGSVDDNPVLPGHSEEEIGYHVYLMEQAGLVEAGRRQTIANPSPEGMLYNMTWDGHEFLALAAKESRWAKVKEALVKEGGALTLEMVKNLLKQYAGLE